MIKELLRLIKINTKISSLSSIDSLLQEIMNEAMQLSGTTSSFILEVNHEAVVCRNSHHFLKEIDQQLWSSKSAREAVKSKNLHYLGNALDVDPTQSVLQGDIRTLISVPLFIEDSSTSIVLQLVGHDHSSVRQENFTLLRLLASQAEATIARGRLESQVREKEKLAAVGLVAEKVAHDIRSPLSALKILLASFKDLTGTEKYLLENSVSRIEDISNSLSASHLSNENNSTRDEILCELLASVVSEKQLQHEENSHIVLNYNFERESQFAFVNINRDELSRIISNILTNSIEAKGDEIIVIDINLSVSNGIISIAIKDNGVGIPKDKLPLIFDRGFSWGKTKGSGLGLFGAKEVVARWRGAMTINSSLGDGTTVNIQLPIVENPRNFVTTIDISNYEKIILLDDDFSVHRGMESILKRSGFIGDLVCFSDYNQAGSYIRSTSTYGTLFLVDYDLGGSNKNGIHFIIENEIHAEVYLLTSRYYDQEVIQLSKKHDIRVYPKSALSFENLILKSAILEKEKLVEI